MQYRVFFYLIVFASLSACGGSSRYDYLPQNPTSMPSPDAVANTYIDPNYALAPFDVLQITVFQVEELTGTYRIDPAGYLDMPLIVPINVVGMDPLSLQGRIADLLGRDYLEKPDVSIQLSAARSATITVEGSVRTPGIYPVVGRTTLLGAVALASGLDIQTANPEKVIVFRKIENNTYAAAFNLKEVRAGTVENPNIYGGDIIVVDGSNLRQTYIDILRTLPLIGVFTRL